LKKYEININYTGENKQELEKREGGNIFTQAVEKKILFNSNKVKLVFKSQNRVMFSLYELIILSLSLSLDQSFVFQKDSNYSGKVKDRVLKLTIDSLFIFKEKALKKQINYSSIISFKVQSDSVLLSYLNNKGIKKVTTFVGARSNDFLTSLQDSLDRYKFYIEIEKQLPLLHAFDEPTLSFIKKCKKIFKKGKLYDDKKYEKKVITSINVPKISTDFKNFFKKFETEDGKILTTKVKDDEINFEKSLIFHFSFTNDEISHIQKLLDPTNRGFVTFHDFLLLYIDIWRKKTHYDKFRNLKDKEKN
jgi:hypothetical protein